MGGKTNGKAGDTEDEVRSTHAPPSVCSDWSDWSVSLQEGSER